MKYCARKVDPCIKEIVDSINKDTEFKTLSSCCGHGIYPATIVVESKATKYIFEWYSLIPIPRKKRNRYYTKENRKKRGLYNIKEVSKAVAH